MPYWRLAGVYFFYFAYIGAFAPYFSLYLSALGVTAAGIADGLVREFGDAVYAQDDRSIEQRVVDDLVARGLTIATGESCTAGLIAARIAGVPGASTTLRGGIAAYANDVKTEIGRAHV